MSQTLGEKLRQAREDRGVSISEVAEQTRISPHYIECIENDDYGPLPGGIFNKGFVKSYAKFVGVDEQEALADYSRLQSTALSEEPDLSYRPEVLTDDRTSNSSIPTIIGAIVILGIMSAGVLFLVDYLRRPAEDTPVRPTSNTAATNTEQQAPVSQQLPEATAPDMANVRIEFKAIAEPVSLTVNSDGKQSSTVVNPGTPIVFEPKESLKLSYSRSLAANVQLSINGKEIALPSQPLQPRRNAIDFEINKDNLARIWSSGSILDEVPSAAPTDESTTATAGTPAVEAGNTASPPAAPSATSTPRPTPRQASNVNQGTNSVRPTPRPTAERPATTPASSPAPPRNSAADRPSQ
ncbi:MAG: helix-turn-helix domain-containing protein [Acidobacteria bacterium]|nr:helix-turn-helix domain-containing protein [Acidobacteriota bacterium]